MTRRTHLHPSSFSSIFLLYLVCTSYLFAAFANARVSYRTMDASVVPYQDEFGVNGEYDTFLYEVEFDGMEGGIEIEQEIQLLTGKAQSLVVDQRVPPYRYPWVSIGMPFQVPEIIVRTRSVVGQSYVAAQGAVPPSDIASAGTITDGYIPSSSTSKQAHHMSHSQKQIHQAISQHLAQRKQQQKQAAKEEAAGRHLLDAKDNPHQYNPPAFVPKLDGNEDDPATAGGALVISIINMFLPAGHTFAGGDDSQTGNMVTPCSFPGQASFDTFGLPCSSVLAPVANDPTALLCMTNMYNHWKAEVTAAGGSCSNLAQNVNPNGTWWCDPLNPSTQWTKAAVNYMIEHRQARITMGVTMPNCSIPRTNFPPPGNQTLQFLTPPNDATAQSSCSLLDANNDIYNATQAVQVAESFYNPNTRTVTTDVKFGSVVLGQETQTFPPGIDTVPFNVPDPVTGVHNYYDSPDCGCAPSDNGFYYTCPNNPWEADIPRGYQLLGDSSPLFRTGTLQKCHPINQHPASSSLADRKVAFSDGGYCVELIDDVLAFDYSTVVSETFVPPFPEGCPDKLYGITGGSLLVAYELAKAGFTPQLAIECAILRIAAHAAAILHFSSYSDPCSCDEVTVSAGSFAALRQNAKNAQDATLAGLATSTRGLMSSIARDSDYLQGTLIPNLNQATEALDNTTALAQLLGAGIHSFEALLQTQALLNNLSIQQDQATANQMLANQIQDTAAFFKQVELATAVIQALNATQPAFVNHSIAAFSSYIDQVTSKSKQVYISQANIAQADQSLHDSVALYQINRVQLPVLQAMADDLRGSIYHTVHVQGLRPLLSDCDANFTICGTPRQGIQNQSITLDTVFVYALEWQTGFGDSPNAPNPAAQIPRIHQFYWTMPVPLSSILNYQNVTATIDQLRGMIAPGAFSVQSTHRSCLSSTTLNLLVPLIEQSNGGTGQFGSATLIDLLSDSSHSCQSGTIQQHESNTSTWSFQWDQSVQTACQWPSLLSYSLWPGYWMYRGGVQGQGMKLAVPYTPSHCAVDKFSRELAETQTGGQSTIVSMVFGRFALSFALALGSPDLMALYRAMQVDILPQFGLVHQYKTVGVAYDQNAMLSAVFPSNFNFSDTMQSVFQVQDPAMIEVLANELRQQQFTGLVRSTETEYLAINDVGIGADIRVIQDAVQPNITFRVANIQANVSIDDALSTLQFFSNQSYASLGAVIDESKLATSAKDPMVLFAYLGDWILERGSTVPQRRNIPQTRASFVYDVDPEDVALYPLTMLEKRGLIGALSIPTAEVLTKVLANGTYHFGHQFQFPNSNLSAQIRPDRGLNAYAYLNVTGQRWDTRVSFKDVGVTTLWLEEAFAQRQTITNDNFDVMQETLDIDLESISVSLESYKVPSKCVSSIPAAPFDDYKLYRCSCGIPTGQKKRVCRMFDLYLLAVPVDWLSDGSNPDWWDRIYLQPIRQKFQYQTRMPRSVTKQIQEARSPCPRQVLTNDTDITFLRPNLGQNLTLQFHFEWASINFINTTNSSYQDCLSWTQSLLAPEGWQHAYNLNSLLWESKLNISYTAAQELSAVQSQQTIALPLGTRCQLLSFDIHRDSTQCSSWRSTGINTALSVQAAAAIDEVVNDFSSRNNLVVFAQTNIYGQLADQVSAILSQGFAILDLTTDDLQHFVTIPQLAQINALLANASSGFNQSDFNQPAGSYSLGDLLVVQSNSTNTTAPQSLITFRAPNNTASLFNSTFSNQTAQNQAQNFGLQFNLSWSSNLNDINQVARSLVDQFKTSKNIDYTVSLAIDSINNVVTHLADLVSLTDQPSPFGARMLAAFRQLNNSAILRSAMNSQAFKDMDSAGFQCMEKDQLVNYESPGPFGFKTQLADQLLATFYYAQTMDRNRIVNGDPGSWGNWISNFDGKVAFLFFFWMIVILIFWIFVFAPVGSLDFFQESSSLFFVANWANVFWSPDPEHPGYMTRLFKKCGYKPKFHPEEGETATS